MTERERFLKNIGDSYATAARILTERSVKYAPEDNPFANIEESAEIADTDVYQSIMTRFGDKVGRIRQCLRNRREGDFSESSDESLDDSILDAINYLVMLRVKINEDNEQSPKYEDDEALFKQAVEDKPSNWFDSWRSKLSS